MQPVELYFEFASHYSYISLMLTEQAAHERGVRINYRPFLLGPILNAEGYTDPPFIQFKAKGAYAWRDIERLCADAGLAFRRPSVFPRKSVLPARVALIGFDEGWGLAFSREVFRLNFVEDCDMEDEGNLRTLLSNLGQSPEPVLARALSVENKERLKQQTEHARQMGVFGAPTFVVGSELFWGQDRMQQALNWASKH